VSRRTRHAAERRYTAARRDLVRVGCKLQGARYRRSRVAESACGKTVKAKRTCCARWAALVIVSIDATDGTVRTVQTLQPPVKPFPPGIPLAAPGTSSATVLVGPISKR
jgi:hypothetical protein